ncbi:peptide ABC transporter substrate-binding protein [Bombilactobacillus bombi]|uniref:peptide ABC transporter substrate-binding protein n=1 Tax=Bombilactobacillus bombi TaxID=1303590 RepID=UPI0015E5E832|nr:peptide ABC transporter substrate-binding protein [Bombilactobacillus bombi]MBA1433691.1 peptide ABC transporter substrate-binding protein [Bombilactobacillus bombi]
MSKKSFATIGLAIMISALTLTGCQAKQQSQVPKDTYRTFVSDVIPTMDSSVSTDMISGQALTDTMEGLYRYQGKTIMPALATKVVSPTNDGLTYTIPLKKNTQWSNGQTVTAQDFVFAWRRTVDPRTKSQYAYICEGIANAKEITAGKKPVNSLGIKALDKYTLQVTLDKPLPYFNELMTSAVFFPQNQTAVKKWGKKYGTNSKTLVFNGPYKLVNWNGPDNSWKEVKNPHYWNAKKVKVQQLNYQVVKDSSTSLNLYQANKLDRTKLTGDISKQMKNSSEYKIQKQNSTFYLEMNRQKDSIFKNTKICQAISLAINRQQLTKKILGNGTIAATSFTPTNMAFDPNNSQKDFVEETSSTGKAQTSYNLKRAKQLWKLGLAETNNTDKKFKLILLDDDSDIAKQQDEYLQNQLEKLPGMQITINNVPLKGRLSRSENGNFDLVVSGWTADFPDPINYLTLFTTGASNNYGKWSNNQYDTLVNKSMTTDANNPSQRWQDMIAAQNLINNQQAVIPLYQNGAAWLTHKRVHNLDYGPSGMYNMVSLRIKD